MKELLKHVIFDQQERNLSQFVESGFVAIIRIKTYNIIFFPII